jgi:hypothetical protein
MLSSFCCSMIFLKLLRLLNVPLKESYVIFIIWEHIIMVFSFNALFGLTWRMLTPCLTLTSRHKPLWSFGFWLVIPLYASVNNVLSLCMIMAIIALLVGHSQSFASLHLYWVWALLVHPTPKNQVFQCFHHIYLLAICYSKYISLAFIYPSNLTFCVMWKLVSKALTNLTANLLFCF